MAGLRGMWHGAVCALTIVTLTACTSGPDAPRGLTAAGPAMQSSPRVPGAVVWRKPGLDAARYTRFIVSPVKMYEGPDSDYGRASPADRQAMAQFMRQEYQRALGQRFRVTSTPGPNTARLDLTLAGLSGNVPVAATAASVLPLGVTRNLLAGGQSPMLSGSVTYKGELYDAQTGELLAAFVTSKTPGALDLGATISDQAAQQAAITESAQDFRDAMGSAQLASARGAR